MTSKKESPNGNPHDDRNDGICDNDDVRRDILDQAGMADDEIEFTLDDESASLADEANKESRAALLSIVERKDASENAAEEVRENEPNLVKRAKALSALQVINFDEIKWVGKGSDAVATPVSCDMNRIAVFKALFGTGKQRPHFDEFVGRVVDHRGSIIDDHYPAVEILQAVSAAGMKMQSARAIRDTLREYALTYRRNDMIDSIVERMPEWDGVPRLDTLLVDMFRPFDTPLNRKVSRYFFLSLYARLMHPGALAPLVVFLVGGQNAGKSHFGRLICQYVLNSKKADSIPLDLGASKNDFLREITGTSVIAQIGEMTGFTRGDMNKIKDFVTKTTDSLNYKFEGSIQQPRQWVMLMDGNTYEGLQRDNTGNRRFYPLFCGQMDDDAGKPQWDANFEVDFSRFENDFWQVMAEAASVYDGMGDKEYVRFVREVVSEVKEFNFDEMRMDRGTIADEKLDMHLIPALRKTPIKVFHSRGTNPSGVIVDPSLLLQKLTIMFRVDVNVKHLDTKMSALGFEKITGAGNRKVYLMPNIRDERSLHRKLGIEEEDVPDDEGHGSF